MLRGEAPVVGDHHALGLLTPSHDVLRDPVGAAPHVFEGVVVGDLRAPAVGAEDDLRGLRDLADRGHELASSVEHRSRSGSIRDCSLLASRSTATGPAVATIVASGPGVAIRRPDAARQIRRSSAAVSKASPVGSIDASMPGIPSSPRSALQLPRSFQPTSIAPITTCPAAAAGSMTA